MKITSLQQLKDWNRNPTAEAPTVLEWFLDWFFEELVMKNRVGEAKDARQTMIEFTMKCEKMNEQEAIQRVDSNFLHYADYGFTTWRPAFYRIFEVTLTTGMKYEVQKG